MAVEELIAAHATWVYPVTFVWTLLEGESFVLYAGLLASHGLVDVASLIACAWLGTFLGDQCYFALGRRMGRALLDRFPSWRPRVDVVSRRFERFDAVFILAFRFLYGVRNFAAFGLGTSTVSWRRFSGLNFAAAGVWAVSFVAAGYLCGRAGGAILGDTTRFATYALLGGLVLLGGAGVVRKWWNGREARERLRTCGNGASSPTTR
jgi:membrane protein DedA with SNARE-associated domain